MAAVGVSLRHVGAGSTILASVGQTAVTFCSPRPPKQPPFLPSAAAVCSPSVLPEFGDILFFLSFIYIPRGRAAMPT